MIKNKLNDSDTCCELAFEKGRQSRQSEVSFINTEWEKVVQNMRDEMNNQLKCDCKKKEEIISRLTESLHVAEDALKYYATDPSYKESSYISISSNFKSGNHADITLQKLTAMREERK